MPGPDRQRFWIEDGRPGSARACWQAYDWTGNNGNRKARSDPVIQRIRWGTWKRLRCGDFLPVHLRADALYFGNSCRKWAARDRRAARLRARPQSQFS
jgi:hypothetical protein